MLSPKFYRFLKEQRWFVAGFLVSLVAFIGISFTFLADAIYFNDPRHQNVALKKWMTPRYVVLSYELPREVVFDTLGIKRAPGQPRRMDRIAESQGLTLEELTAKIRAAKASYQETTSD